jgi:hypothetical protein
MLFGAAFVNAEIGKMPFSVGECDIEILQYPHMIQIENKESLQIDTYYDFTDNERSYEVRYSLFRQIEMDYEDIRSAFTVYSIMLIYNIAGYEIDLSNFVFFNDSDVKNEFNGDFGLTGFIQNPISDYGNGYKYIMLNIFCKQNNGIVVRAILSNSINIFLDVDSQRYDEIYHSFKFSD